MKKLLPIKGFFGFSVLELLIVLVIIAAMATMGLMIYWNLTGSARDARRKVDLNFIKSVLSEYYIEHGFYPTFDTAGLSPLSCDIIPNPSPECANLISELKHYANRIPYDPVTDSSGGNIDCSKMPCYYYLTPDPAHTTSCICAKIENPPNIPKPPACQNSPYNYCIQTSL